MIDGQCGNGDRCSQADNEVQGDRYIIYIICICICNNNNIILYASVIMYACVASRHAFLIESAEAQSHII